MTKFHLHLISDSTGETVSTIARAVLAQFDDVEVVEHNWSLIRSRGQLEKLLASIQEHRGVVLYTLVKPELEEVLKNKCLAISVPCIPVLAPAMEAFSTFLTREVQHRPGGQHELDEDYFQRIEAMQFVLSHDDGQALHDIDQADVILTGVSRTSKTPTCVYLANRGLKARHRTQGLDAVADHLQVAVVDHCLALHRDQARVGEHDVGFRQISVGLEGQVKGLVGR